MAAVPALAMASCGRFEPEDRVFQNSIYLDVSALEQNRAANFSNRTEGGSQSLSAVLAYPADKPVTASITVDKDGVEAFNRRNGTDYELLPERFLDFQGATVTIPAGRSTSETVTIVFKGLMGEGEQQTGAMEIDKTYLLPVKVSSADIGSMPTSSEVFYLVKRTSAITVAAQLTDDFICFPRLDDPAETELKAIYNDLTAVTFEALVNIDRFELLLSSTKCDISTIMGVEQYLLLRIGDANFERQQLQFDGSGNGSKFGKIPVKTDARKKLDTGVWYHVAATYDQRTRTARIYLNGKLIDETRDVGVEAPSADNRIRLAPREKVDGKTGEGYCFLVGNSYNRYRPLQGKIAEVRVWSSARTQQEIWENMYRIAEPEAHEDLIGYWKCDDGAGDTVTDYSRYKNHGKFGAKEQFEITTGVTVDPKDPEWAVGIEIPELNKMEE